MRSAFQEEDEDELAPRPDGAAVFARLQAAALADEEGKALARELAEISSVAVVKVAFVPATAFRTRSLNSSGVKARRID